MDEKSKPKSLEDKEWEDLFQSVEITEIPVELIKVLRIHLENGQKILFPIQDWINDGYPISKIEAVLQEYTKEMDNDIASSDIVVDFVKLKNTVTEETKKAFKGYD